jgi:hypothetical protein
VHYITTHGSAAGGASNNTKEARIMSKITFTSTQQPDSTHRISDGMESGYFTWTGGMTGDEIVAAYASGYDTNDGDDAVEIVVYDLDDNSVVLTTEF